MSEIQQGETPEELIEALLDAQCELRVADVLCVPGGTDRNAAFVKAKAGLLAAFPKAHEGIATAKEGPDEMEDRIRRHYSSSSDWEWIKHLMDVIDKLRASPTVNPLPAESKSPSPSTLKAGSGYNIASATNSSGILSQNTPQANAWTDSSPFNPGISHYPEPPAGRKPREWLVWVRKGGSNIASTCNVTEAQEGRTWVREFLPGSPSLENGRPLGFALAMRVIQSDLYERLDEVERAECDRLIRDSGFKSTWAGAGQ